MHKPIAAALLALSTIACASTPAPVPETAAGQPQDASPADVQAARVCQGFDDPSLVTEQLAPSFLAQIPAEQVTTLLGQVQSQLGSCTGVDRVAGDPLQGEYQLSFARGFTAPLRIAVEPEPAHRMTGLWIGPPVARSAGAN